MKKLLCHIHGKYGTTFSRLTLLHGLTFVKGNTENMEQHWWPKQVKTLDSNWKMCGNWNYKCHGIL